MKRIQILTIPAFALFCACGNDNGSTNSTGTDTQGSSPNAVPASIERDNWQQPMVIFSMMGDVKGRTVADLFAGDGYMTFKLIEAGANVIALDTDPAALEAIERRKKELGLTDERLRTRLTTVGEPGLAANEADMALCVHHYTQIQDRGSFFTKVRNGLRGEPKVCCIVDFLPVQSPMGPPLEQRVSERQVMDEMTPTGYTDVGAYTKKIPYQMIVIAQDFIEGPETDSLMMNAQQPS